MSRVRLNHPALSQIATTPEILRLLMANISDDQARWKPAPDRFSIAEVVEHLSHTEGHCYRARLEKMLAEDCPDIEIYDQDAFNAAGAYSGKDAEESFAHFEEQRDDNVVLLSTLEPESLKRRARHPKDGIITLDHLLNDWAFHDLGHIRQITELVRAQVYHPNMGPWTQKYVVKP